MFGVFVRPNHIMNFQAPVNLRSAAHPERCRLHQQGQPFIAHKCVITRDLPVGHNGPGNVRHDVVFGQGGGHFLPHARTDVDSRKFRRLLFAARGALPREQRARPAVAAGFFPGPGQVQPAIAQQAAGHLRTGEKMERQHEYFGVPEDVAFIPLAGQSLSGNTAPLIMGWRHGGQMPDGIVQRHLIVRSCRSHFHPGITPFVFPCAG